MNLHRVIDIDDLLYVKGFKCIVTDIRARPISEEAVVYEDLEGKKETVTVGIESIVLDITVVVIDN